MAKRRGVPVWLLIVALPLAFIAPIAIVALLSGLRTPTYPGLTCLANVKSLVLALDMYASDNSDYLPSSRQWSDSLADYVSNEAVFRCPKAEGPGYYAYARTLSGVSVSAIRDRSLTIAIFESDSERNAAGGPELLPDEPRHLGGDNYGFADGSARWLKRKSAGEGRRGERAWLKEPEEAVRWEP